MADQKQTVPMGSDLAALVAETLDAAVQADLLTDKRETRPMTRPSFSDLYAYATDPLHRPSDGLLASLETDPKVARDFNRLVENMADLRFPQVIAASSGDIERREVPGARLTFKTSCADANQLYVILELEDQGKAPTLLFVTEDQGPGARVELPEVRDGRAQLLIEADSLLAQKLRDIHTQVFLR